MRVWDGCAAKMKDMGGTRFAVGGGGRGPLEGQEWASRMVLSCIIGSGAVMRGRGILGIEASGVGACVGGKFGRRAGAEILRRGMFRRGSILRGERVEAEISRRPRE